MNSAGVKLLKSFAVAALLFLAGMPVGAQGPLGERYLLRELDMEQGLPCSFVDDVCVDGTGFLWLATSGGGLCRYDGYELLTFNVSTDPALGSNFIRNVVEDRFHRLWIASEGGLDVLDSRSLRKPDLDLGPAEPLRWDLCSFVTVAADGAVWAKFGATLFRMAFRDDGSLSGVLSFSHPGMAPVSHVFEDVDRDGSVWTRLDGGLYKIAPGAGGALEATPVALSLDLGAGTYVSDFLVSESSVWIATENGLYRLYKGTGEWKLYQADPADPRSLTQNFVSSLAQTRDGLLLASTLHGLNVYNPVADNFERVGTDIINCIKTNGDRLLVATENRGLRIAVPRTLDVKNVTHLAEDPSSLAPGAVNALWQEPGGRLWAGSVEGGLSVREPGQEGFSHLTRERGGLSHNSVSALRPGPCGQMYVGTWGGGIDEVSMDGRLRVLSHMPNAGGLLDFIGVLEYDTLNGLLWVGSNRGIFLLDPERRVAAPALEETVTGCIGSCIDRHHQLWVGCQEGLYVFDLAGRASDGRFPFVHYRYRMDQPQAQVEEKICAVLEASDGTVYLGSNGGGVFAGVPLPDGTYSFRSFTAQQGLSNDRVRGFCEDGYGQIWVSTEYGLNLLNPRSGVITPFLQKDGLQSVQFHWNNACTGTDGLLYFGHAQGFSVVDPSRFPEAEDPSGAPFCFTCIRAGDREVRDPQPALFQLHERDRSLLLQFAVLDPDAVSTICFRYILEGYDKDWQSLPPGRREAAYSSLPSGRYVFRVRAQNRFGRWVGDLSVPVRVKPAFHHTWWFALLLVSAVVLLVWLFIRWRTRTIRRRQTDLEHTVAERTREISAQKRLVEAKADELRRQNEVLLHQNEELASRKMLSLRQEDPFKGKVLETLRSLYKDPDLDVNRFCQAMGMSKTLLNTHLQEAFGQSIGQIIRTYRLTVAREMLESGSGITVAEVAYEVGFNDPKYFTRCFTKEFGFTPSSAAKG